MKWNSTPVIALVAVLIFAAAVALLILAGGDDGTTTSADPTPSQNTPQSGKFGDPPRLGDNVESVSPEHGTSVSQADTMPQTDPRTGRPLTNGACALVNFQDFGNSPDTVRWFHMAFDGKLVTQLTTVFLGETDPNTGIPADATICFTLDEGLPVGVHQAAISVGDPNVPAAPARQLVGWSFEVTP